MTLNRVLLIGATGHLGRHFVSALQEKGKEVLMLLRPQTVKTTVPAMRALIDVFVGQGAKVVEGSLEDEASVDRVCEAVDAVISCIDAGPNHLLLQAALAHAAKKLGPLRRIIPSQFGIDSRTYGEGRVTHGDSKRELQQLFDSCCVPVTYVHANGFASAWAASLGQLGLVAPPKEQINVFGDGNVKLAMVAPEDIARYTVRALDDVRAENRHVAITPAENLLTQNELIALWESKTKIRLKRHTISARELDRAIMDLAHRPDKVQELSVTQLIRAVWIDGLGGKRRPDVLELTDLYPDIPYQRVTSYLDWFISPAQSAHSAVCTSTGWCYPGNAERLVRG
jgi:uncharacterized protein YbjT (DUF2867 family)